LEGFFLDTKDPLFSVIIFIGIILLISILSYFWGIFSKNDKRHRIENFINKFNQQQKLDNKYIELLKSIDDIEVHGVLADIFVRNGDFKKAINIYLILLEKLKAKKEREEVLTKLGIVYFKAGFLQRASGVLLQALEISPRNEEALRILSVIYENLKDFEREKEVLSSLNELGVATDAESAYVQAKMMQNDKNLNPQEKLEKIANLSGKFPLAARMALEFAIKNRLEMPAVLPKIEDCIDIIWFSRFQIPSENAEFKAIFLAKSGQMTGKSRFYEINAINALQNSGLVNSDLSFKYLCDKCKNTFPTHFYRCPMCYALQSVKIVPKIVEKSDEIGATF